MYVCVCVCVCAYLNSPGGTGHVRWDYNYNTRDALLTLRDNLTQFEMKFNWILDDVGITRRPVRITMHCIARGCMEEMICFD